MPDIQSWVALPEEFPEVDPSFVRYGHESLPVFQGGGAHGRVLAGEGRLARRPHETA